MFMLDHVPPHTQFQSLTQNSETINYLESYLGKQKPTYFDCTQSPMHTPLYHIINLHTPVFKHRNYLF